MRNALIGLTVLIAGCPAVQPSNPVCTEVFVYGLTATVTDEDGAPIEGATLTLTEGNYSETLEGIGGGTYIGAGERAGTYSLTVEAEAFAPETIERIVVDEDECHVIPVERNVVLSSA